MWAGALLGCAGAWIGLTIQHCGNHGAMSTKPWVNNALGMGMDLIGGSSLMWRYHHQVRTLRHVRRVCLLLAGEVWAVCGVVRPLG